MHFDDYQRYDALGLADLVRRGEVHPSELLDAALARADATRSLNAIVMRLDESARQRAQAAFDTSAPFAGVPFLVKDLDGSLAGEPCTFASRSLRDYVPDHDSELILTVRRPQSAFANAVASASTWSAAVTRYCNSASIGSPSAVQSGTLLRESHSCGTWRHRFALGLVQSCGSSTEHLHGTSRCRSAVLAFVHQFDRWGNRGRSCDCPGGRWQKPRGGG